MTPGLIKQIIELYGTTAGEGGVLNVHVAVPQVQKQSGKTDCGCFAIAWTVHLAYGDKPETIILDQTKLCSHLETCLLKQQFTPFSHTIKKTQCTRSHFLLNWTSFTFRFCVHYNCFSVLHCSNHQRRITVTILYEGSKPVIALLLWPQHSQTLD